MDYGSRKWIGQVMVVMTAACFNIMKSTRTALGLYLHADFLRHIYKGLLRDTDTEWKRHGAQ